MDPTPVTCGAACTVTYVVQAPSPQDYIDLGFSASHLASCMGFGLGFVLFFWFAGYVAAVGVGIVRKV